MADLYADIPELSAEAQANARRRKIAEAMMQQGQAPLESMGMAGGAPIPISWTQGLAKLAQAYVGGKQVEDVETADKALADKYAGMETDAVSKVRDAMFGTPERQAPFQADNPFGEDLGTNTTVTPAQPATPEARRQAIIDAQLSRFPQVQKFGAVQQKYDEMDQAQAATREQRKWEVQQKAQDKLDQIEMQAREGRITRAEADARSAELKKSLVTMAAALRPAPQPVAPTVLTDKQGNVTLLDRTGNVIKKLDAAGKPSATYEKTVAAKAKMGNDLDSTIRELEKATADGGLIDQSTGSGAGALVDMAAGFVGKATPGSIAVGQMKPIYDMALKMVPRFEGPQSDKDTASYAAAAGDLANPAVPNSRKKAAGREILRLMKARKGQFVDSGIAGTEADTPVTNEVRTVDW